MTTTTDDLMVRELAEHAGVCIRPLVRKLVDLDTGDTRHVPIACGSTREKVCPPCAAKARALRQQQCREGWHREDEPDFDDTEHDSDADSGGVVVPDLTGLDGATARESTGLELIVTGLRYEPNLMPGTVIEQRPKPGTVVTAESDIGVVVSSHDEGDKDEGVDSNRRRRSTKRRSDVGDLPKRPTENTTLGRTFTSPAGKTYRPSMFLTFTLPSYGRVRSDGTPYDPDSYDYRKAALDALHFPKLVDRIFQALRRGAEYQVQYFATVEPQKRLALHLHAAVRGTIPRETVRKVVGGVYHQVWWPHFNEAVYTDHLPVWNPQVGGYVDPDSGQPLPTWDQALDRIDPTSGEEPAHMIRPGSQFDYQGIIAANESDIARSVGYLTKYLTKSVAETYDPETITKRQKAHRARLHAELRWLPCSPKCTNWLRYGVQPKGAEDGMTPGECGKPAHELDNLGHGGRRVLVSRQWTGKRLAEHKADRAAVVRATLAEAGIDMPDTDRYAADATNEHGEPRYQWEDVPLDQREATPDDRMPSYRELIRASVAERNRWREQYTAAQELLAARDRPPDDTRSANPPAAIAAQSGGTR